MADRAAGSQLSQRLLKMVGALPLKDGMRVLEIGCGPGAMAREMSKRVDNGYVLAIDRSAKAIQQAMAGSQPEMKTGRLAFKKVAIENFERNPDDTPFDLALAVRVGALDGRHPEIEKQALQKIAKALGKRGRLFIDSADTVKEVLLKTYR